MRFAPWPRGFLLASEPRDDLALPDGFTAEALGPGLWVARDATTTQHVARAPGAVVAVLGLILDPARPEATGDDIAAVLAARATDGARMSFGAIEQELARLVGRYVVVAATHHGTALWTDASGQRATYQARDARGTVVASHAGLLAEVLGRPRCPRVAAFRRSPGYRAWRGSKPLPGLVTPWVDVEVVPPSQRLDLTTGRLTRMRLLEPLEPVSLRSAVEVLEHDLHGAAVALARRAPVAVSLTGGVDSRAALACARGIAPALELFTYHRDNDVQVATEIARALKLRHFALSTRALGKDEQAAWRSALSRLTWLSHGPSLPSLYRQHLRPDTVHVRSVYGHGRGFYRLRHGRDVEGRSARDLAQAYMGLGEDPFVVDAFERFIAATNWAAQQAIDPLEALYLEHRVPQFHALVLLESDVALDACSTFNNWRTHEALLGYGLGHEGARGRDAADVCRAVTEAAWPRLAALPYG